MFNPHSITLCEDKIIRGVCLLNQGTKAAVTTLLQVMIVDLWDGTIVTTIKRLSPPRVVVPIPNKNYMLIHYSDNYCMLYDTMKFEPIYTMLGIANDSKGIKVSENGKHMLHGNSNAIQMWNINSCHIEMLSQQFKFISAYAIHGEGEQIYLGTYGGFINIVRTKTMREYNNSKIPIGQEVRIHDKCVMGIEAIDANTVVSVDYGLQFAVIKVDARTISFNFLCKIQFSAQITKPIVFSHTKSKGKLYLQINDVHYRVDCATGATDIVEQGRKEAMLTNLNNSSMYLAEMINKYSIEWRLI